MFETAAAIVRSSSGSEVPSVSSSAASLAAVVSASSSRTIRAAPLMISATGQYVIPSP
jgi:hypothetical protein